MTLEHLRDPYSKAFLDGWELAIVQNTLDIYVYQQHKGKARKGRKKNLNHPEKE